MGNSSTLQSPRSVPYTLPMRLRCLCPISKLRWVRTEILSHSAWGSLAQLPATEKWKCSGWVLDLILAALRCYKQNGFHSKRAGSAQKAKQKDLRKSKVTAISSTRMKPRTKMLWTFVLSLKITFCVLLSSSNCKTLRWKTPNKQSFAFYWECFIYYFNQQN